MSATRPKLAGLVCTGDTLAEADGFLWKVTDAHHTPRMVRLTLEPVVPSMTARGPVAKRLRASATVRAFEG